MKAEIIKDSVGPNGIRLTTFLCIYPLIIHAEHLRHKPQSFSVASGRAIPAEKVQAQVRDDSFIPLEYQGVHKGMQGTEVIDRDEPDYIWQDARDAALGFAEELTTAGVTKQLANRLIGPFIMTRVVCTATQWGNFFSLRIHDAAEIHINALAVLMKKAMDESTPQVLQAGEWHLPFVESDDKIEVGEIMGMQASNSEIDLEIVKVSGSRCAYTSYNRNTGKGLMADLEVSNTKLIPLRHWSPFEHQAMATDLVGGRVHVAQSNIGAIVGQACETKGMELRLKYEDDYIEYDYWSRNLRGWVQARSILDGE